MTQIQLPTTHQWFARAVGKDTIHIHFIRADHHVGMIVAAVATLCHEFLVAHVATTLNRATVGKTNRNVAGSILVQQCHAENHAGFIHRRTAGDQCDLAQVACAFVCVQELLERLQPNPRVCLDHPTIFELEAPIFAERAHENSGFRATHRAVDAQSVWGGEDLKGGNVRHVHRTV
jgi:hypothetical protein